MLSLIPAASPGVFDVYEDSALFARYDYRAGLLSDLDDVLLEPDLDVARLLTSQDTLMKTVDNRARLIEAMQTAFEDLRTVVSDLNSILATENSVIEANSATAIKLQARALKTVTQQMLRVSKAVSGSVLDLDLGPE